MPSVISQPHPRVLLVEGRHDKHVDTHLGDRAGLDANFEIMDKEGKVPLLDAIEGEVDAPGRTVLGILLDADESPSARWQAVADRLSRTERPALARLPDQPCPKGTIVEGSPRVGIWLMPDNQSSGELEDFVATMIPGADPVWPLSKRYICDIPLEHRKFTDKKTLRARVHAWLATRKEPRRMGLAIKAGDLDADAPNAKTFVDWLKRLFA